MGNALGAGPGGYWFTTKTGVTDSRRILLMTVIIFAIIAVIIVAAVLGSGSSKSGGSNREDAYYLAAGNGESTTKTLIWSENGAEWKSTSGSFESFGRDVQFYNGTSMPWLAVGTDSADIRGTILWSKDGKTWNKILSGGFKFGTSDIDGGYSVVYNSTLGMWVATGGRVVGDEITSTIQWSTNGKNWNSAESGGFTNRGVEIYYDGNKKTFVATGVDDDAAKTIQTSTDGKNWVGISGSTFSVEGGLGVTSKNR